MVKKVLRALLKEHTTAFLLCLAAVLTLVAFLINLRPKAAESGLSSLTESVLIIDAGHGGIDGGAIGVDGSRESDINLAIARKLQMACDFYGVRNIMTRTDDSRGSDALTYSEHAELVYRTELANSVPNGVFMSIHQNCFPTAQPSGPQVLFADNELSRQLGQLTHSKLVSCLDPQNRRLAEPDKNNIFVLSKVKCPAVLVECGFVSNHSDITKLNDPSYQTSLSTVLLASYLQFTNTRNSI